MRNIIRPLQFLFVCCIVIPFTALAAKPSPECDKAGKNFEKIRAELSTYSALVQCSTTSGAKNDISPKFNAGICKTVFTKIHDGMSKFNSDRKSGCLNIQKHLAEASSCSGLNGSSQVACFTQASLSFTAAAAAERSSVSGLDPFISDLETLAKEADQAQQKYRTDNASLSTHTVVPVKGGPKVDPANGSSISLPEYRSKIPNLVEETFTAKNFAEKFVTAAKTVKSDALARATEWENEAKKMKTVMNPNPSTPPPPAEATASGSSGISMPSMGGGGAPASPQTDKSGKKSKISASVSAKKSPLPESSLPKSSSDGLTIYSAIKSVLTNPSQEPASLVGVDAEGPDQNISRAPANSKRGKSDANADDSNSGISSPMASNGTKENSNSEENRKVTSSTGPDPALESADKAGAAEAANANAESEQETEESQKVAEQEEEKENSIGSEFSEKDENRVQAETLEGPLESLFFRITNKLESAHRKGWIQGPKK